MQNDLKLLQILLQIILKRTANHKTVHQLRSFRFVLQSRKVPNSGVTRRKRKQKRYFLHENSLQELN